MEKWFLRICTGRPTGKCKSRPLLYAAHEHSMLAGAVSSSPKSVSTPVFSQQKHSLKNDASHCPLGWPTDGARHGMPDSGICRSKARLLAQPSPWWAQAYHTCQRLLSPWISESHSHLKDVIQRQGIRKVGCMCLGCCCCLEYKKNSELPNQDSL